MKASRTSAKAASASPTTPPTFAAGQRSPSRPSTSPGPPSRSTRKASRPSSCSTRSTTSTAFCSWTESPTSRPTCLRGKVSDLFPATRSILSISHLRTDILSHYDLGDVHDLTFLKMGLNDTYEVRASTGKYILRVYRAGWRSESDIRY